MTATLEVFQPLTCSRGNIASEVFDHGSEYIDTSYCFE